MKKILVCLCWMFFLFGIIGNANGTPLYYTFEGTVTRLSDGYSAFPEDIGDIVKYVFLIDSDRQGTTLYSDGTTFEYEDSTSGYDYSDYFYAEYIGGSAPPVKDFIQYSFKNMYGEATTHDTGTRKSNWGYFLGTDEVNYIRISWGTEDGPASISSWSIGKEFGASNVTYFYDIDRVGASGLQSDVTLTSISEMNPFSNINPVPEPASIILLGSGLIGLAGVRKKKLNKIRI